MVADPRMVKIPFRVQFREALLSGQKTATSRFQRYGNPLDNFQAFGATFEILAVSQITLYEVAASEYKAEGFSCPLDFLEVWERIHPRRKVDEYTEVWFHVFRRLPDAH